MDGTSSTSFVGCGRKQERRKRRLNACKRAALISLVCLCLFGPARAQSTAAPAGDTQLWPEIQTSFRIRPQASLFLFGTMRPGRNVSTLVDEQVGVGLNLGFAKYFTISPTYRYIMTQPSPQRHLHEHRFLFDFTVRVPIKGGWAISHRSRTELRDTLGVFSERYRDRLQIERTLSFGKRKVTPYLSGELFYDTRFRTWNRERVNIGVRLPLAEQLALDLYYAYQHDERLRPYKLHTVAIRFNLSL